MASLQRVTQGTWLVHAGCVPLLKTLEQEARVSCITSHITSHAAQIIEKFQTTSAPSARNITSQRRKYIIAAYLPAR